MATVQGQDETPPSPPTPLSDGTGSSTSNPVVPQNQSDQSGPPPPAIPSGMPVLSVGILAGFAIITIVVLVANHNPNYNLATANGVGAPDLTKVLAPFLTIATGIERFWEALFSSLESFALSGGQILGTLGRSLKELNDLKRAVVAEISALRKQENPPSQDVLDKAQARLDDANQSIAAALKSPDYVGLKQAVTVFGSLCLGEVASITLHLGFFHSLGVHIPRLADMACTGLLIGAGPGPLHQIINSVGDLRSALSGIAQAGRQSPIGVTVNVPTQSQVPDGDPAQGGGNKQAGK